ncbi:unnamed protein product, partial [Effrenium voratum]
GGARNQVDVAEAAMQRGLDALNDIDLAAVLRVRTLTLQGVPGWLRGLLAFALRAGLRLIRDAPGDARAQETAGWKLFMLAPRMLLSRARGQARIAPADLEQRVRLFKAGEWAQLLQPAQAPAGVTSGRPPPDSLEARARALTAEPLAPGNEETLQELRDPARRPQVPRVPVPGAVLQHQQASQCGCRGGAFVSNVRRARRGAAPGPSGCTNEHLRLPLEGDGSLRRTVEQLHVLFRRALRLGRMVALRKPNGRVRGLVMGDTFRRLVARTLAQQFSAAFDTACRPF